MRRGRLTTAAVTAIVLGALGVGAARAQAASLCPSAAGPWEYQTSLLPFLNDPAPTPPTPGGPPPPPPVSTNGGANGAAREALGAQFSGLWLNSGVQGWVVGLAPGPLNTAAARSAIVERLRSRFSESDVAYLDSRLYLDAQLYGQDELQTARDGVESTLRSDPDRPPWSSSVGCGLSDMRRVEIGIFNTATPEQIERVTARLAPWGDKVRIELLPYGPPQVGSLPGMPAPPRAPAAIPRVSFGRHVNMPILRRCVLGREVNIAARASQPAVGALTVRAGGRSRTIAGRRLAKPLTVTLIGRRTKVVVTVRLADGRVGTATVTYTRCR